ncbi:MAG: hypothetical protein IJ109_01615 [Firmicutes bacterium]|nr:hypothetical protein [Bacillota bacterium]
MSQLKGWLQKGLFKGRHQALKYTAAMIFMVAACVATMGTLAFTSMISTGQYEVTGLDVKQDGTGLEVNWEDADADGYEVFLQTNGERPKIYRAQEPHCRIELDVLDLEYRVTVTAVNRIGGLSAATSDNVTTQKLEQTVETEKDKYVGLEDKKGPLEAEAHGDITYTSSDPSVVAVSRKGVMSYKKDGHAEVTIQVAEGDQYKAAEKTVAVTVYPDTLDTPQMKVGDKTDTTVTLRWDPVEYAKGYTLRRYDPAKKKYRDLMEFTGDTISVEMPRDQAKYKLKATATVGEDQIESEPSEAVKVKATAASAESYGGSHNLMTLDGSNMEVVAHISGSGGASVPQSMSHVGNNYVVTYVDHGGSTGALVTYSNQGERLDTTGISGMGHANGSTYNPNTKRVYTVKTHRQIRSAECSAYDPETGSREKVFQLPKVTSGIAYDWTNNKYCLSKGNEIYVCDDEFNVEKFIWKRIRYNHAQDIGAYNGVAMVCTWVAGNTSYIDLYRISDGAYLGSYNVPIGEIESCFVDDKHLVILMNNGTGGMGDCILRTVDPIAIP